MIPKTPDLWGAGLVPAARRLVELSQGQHPATYHAVVAGYRELSDELYRTAEQIGFDVNEAWRLLRLRDSLDSHLLAADALAEPGPTPTASLALLQQGAERLIDRLPATVAAGNGPAA